MGSEGANLAIHGYERNANLVVLIANLCTNEIAMIEHVPQTTQVPPHLAAFRAGERLGLGVTAFLLTGLLSVAAWLEPATSGMGTHQKLGLPPCTMNYVLGIRCPGCGMTTSWAHTMNGDVATALQCNTGGVLLCLLAMALVPILAILAYRGRPTRGYWLSRTVLVIVTVIVTISILEWLIRLASG
jgi:hypothetical protein